MTVRFKLALTVFATGLVTALLVVATVVFAFQRFEHETASRRGSAFLGRVASMYDNLVELHAQSPIEFERWLRGLVLYEPDTELYLLGLDGRVLARTGTATLAPDFRVSLAPVKESIAKTDMPYVMGDDPERMDADAVVVARPVRRGLSGDAASDRADAGYLYLVLHTAQSPEGRWDALRAAFARPALGLVLAIIAFTTLVAVLLISAVTRPLRQLTAAVSTLSQRGLAEGLVVVPQSPLPKPTPDEFGRLTVAFEMLLDVCRRQWDALRRVDRFRREGVSNLSHDLRSPLTATVACLETLDARWAAADAPDRADDRRLVEIALRNTRNAARMVRSLGDLAKLDEPAFEVRRETVDLSELLDDIVLRFAERAAQAGIDLQARHGDVADDGAPPAASVDVELVERAVANLVDNALKFCPRGSRVTLSAARRDGAVEVSVADDGPGVDAADLPHLFDRFYQSRSCRERRGERQWPRPRHRAPHRRAARRRRRGGARRCARHDGPHAAARRPRLRRAERENAAPCTGKALVPPFRAWAYSRFDRFGTVMVPRSCEDGGETFEQAQGHRQRCPSSFMHDTPCGGPPNIRAMSSRSLLDVDIPAQPDVLVKLSLLLAEESVDVNAVSQLVASDMALAAAVLKAVNSAMYGLRGRVQSVQQAITYLGTREVAAVTFEMGLRAVFPPAPELDPVWERASVRGLLMGRIAQMLGVDAWASHSAGLFEECGKAVMFRHATERYRPLLAEARDDQDLLLLEHDAIGVSHDALGAALCESWGLSPPAVDSVRYHVMVNATYDLPMHVPKRTICAISAMAHALMTDPDSLDDVARKVAPQADLDPMEAQRGARKVKEQIEMAVEREKTD